MAEIQIIGPGCEPKCEKKHKHHKGHRSSGRGPIVAAALVQGTGVSPGFITSRGFSTFSRSAFHVYSLTLSGSPPPDDNCVVNVTLCSRTFEYTTPRNLFAQVTGGVVIINFVDTSIPGNADADFYVTVTDDR